MGFVGQKRSDKSRIFRTLALAMAAFCLLVVSIFVVRYRSLVSAEALEEGARVEEGSLLQYYLTVKGDGIDKDGVRSSDTTISEARSGFLRVSDKLPDGLEFVDFVTSDTGAFRAVARSDKTTGCHGTVVDDSGHEYAEEVGEWNDAHTVYNYRGLHYDAETRTIDFVVNDLGGGCQLTVGVITRTPFLGQSNRMDFYNTANLKATSYNKNSNTVHSWMGRDDESTYRVSYQYTGDVPDGAPSIDDYPERNYAAGSTVDVLSSPVVAGYEFSGWTARNVNINNGSFSMPSEEVVLTGVFTQKTAPAGHKVSYVIEGAAPKYYRTPKEHSYQTGEIVAVDSSEPGLTLDEYIFQGWQSEDVNIVDGGFEMPNKDVVIKGSFRLRTYTVEYRFSGENLPPNSEALLPASAQYPAGATVTRADNPSADGYVFVGWFKNKTFEMPAEDVVIYGEWATSDSESTAANNYFAPTITKTLANPKKPYDLDDIVEFNIVVTNTAAYPIDDVLIQEMLEGSYFEEGEGYIIETPQIASISRLAAGESVTLKATFDDTSKAGRFKNIVEITAATAAEGMLNPSANYRATVDFNVGIEDELPDDGSGNDSVPGTGDSNILAYVITSLGGFFGIVFIIRRNRKA